MNDPVSWRRLGGGAAATFLVIGAFLAGRVNGGTDPAVGTTSATGATTSTSASSGTSATRASDPNPPTTAAS